MSLTLSELIMYNVLHITMLDAANKPIGTATGFLFGFCETDGKHVICLVTNRHVLASCASIRISFTRMKSDEMPDVGNLLPVEISTVDTIFHPNISIDLAILPISHVINRINAAGENVFYRMYTVSNIPDTEAWKQYCAIENVIMAGYPKGFRDEINNQPIIRSGITATHPGLDFRGRPEFLIDMPCFEGCSGSPVLICDEGVHINKRTGSIATGNKLDLLGIQYAIPLQHNVGQLATLPTDNQKSVPVVQLYINLGFIIKSTELLVFEGIIRAKLNS